KRAEDLARRMHTLYLLSVYLHILCAIVWIGGIAFLVFVVVPWLRSGGERVAGLFLRETGTRFRSIGWGCFVVLLATGTFNLYVRGVHLADFGSAAWRSTAFGEAVLLKLGLFIAVLITSAIHDFFVGPRATRAIEADATSLEAARLRKQAQRLGRLNAVFALLLVGVAITLVRGAP
ncbi:MAG: DUF4149 domain-containing protein, partial [Myxococcales bacterium]|nr:DUF4149 domain-containing protein [Myxococcales bacterium]